MNIRDIYLLSPELSLVVLGLLVIVLDLFLRRHRWALNALAWLGLTAPLGFSLALWANVNSCDSGTLTGFLAETCAQGKLGGLYGTLVVDKFSLFFKFLTLGSLALVVMASVDYVRRFQRSQGEYYALLLFSAVGMMLLAASTELISLYVALELTALPLAALAAFLRTPRSSEAGVKLLLLSAISSAVLLYGMALIFGVTGTTHLGAIAEVINQISPLEGVPFGNYALFLGITLLIAGFGFKIAAVPFQMWVPDVYEGAPTPITAYLSVASKAAGFAVILRVFYTSFGSLEVDWGLLFAALAAASMTIGNLVAIAQRNIKRLLAYSTIAHVGYLLIGLAAIGTRVSQGETIGPESLLFYLVAYGFTSLAAFFSIMAISNWTDSEEIDAFKGMWSRAPWLALALSLSLISLIGVPPTAGFMGKLFLFGAAVKSNMAWLAMVGVANSVLSAYYYMRVVRIMFITPSNSDEKVPSSGSLRIALGLASLGIVFFGVAPLPLFRLAESAIIIALP
jgi:NADH-quinone oxidoreductase subunit N